MDEIHQAPYSGQPGYQKIIATARKQYFWLRMKKDIAKYMLGVCSTIFNTPNI